jgi:hypothetical protein
VTTSTESLAIAFPVTSGDAGFGTFCLTVNSANARFLVYCDEENGAFLYTESSDTWAQITAAQITGVNPENLVFCTVWKSRLWFVERDTTKAWYLAANAVIGAASVFDFGNRMQRGGDLRGLYDWSYDGGSGLDSSLVAVSGSGDVVIYQGTDPASASTFGIKGSWSVSGVPKGRRIAVDHGGELLVLSVLGPIPLSRLVTGAPETDGKQYSTHKIANLFSSLASIYRFQNGWSLFIHPTDNALVVTVPNGEGQATNQLVMALGTPYKGWSRYRDLPLYSAGVWNGDVYFGTTDGRICKNAGYVDGMLLSDPSAYDPVDWSLLTSFQSPAPGRTVQVTQIRPRILSQEFSPTISAAARYGFDLSEASEPVAGAAASNAWDTAIWDTTLWASEFTESHPIIGGSGMGQNVAVALRGSAISRTTVVEIEVMFKEGGAM